jgi:hypothetical protein
MGELVYSSIILGRPEISLVCVIFYKYIICLSIFQFLYLKSYSNIKNYLVNLARLDLSRHNVNRVLSNKDKLLADLV